ncbi:unnamed protein product [Pseudo-nitzschia multistriata]|uniref:Glycosyltransferase family 92 protein n=1 Tax=Pseudo-nitzschia multistriata TaxID=183589 RepID=A0A448YUU2_9STRA|nr:unnamed protein product [Pseudo-nitzschia multistriata]
MGLKAKVQNGGNMTGIGIRNRKRGPAFTAAGLVPNGRRVSQATLQRVFITMMGVVFLLWSTITVMVFRWGQNTFFQKEVQGNWGPPVFNMNKNKQLKEHIRNLRKDHDRQNEAARQPEKKKHKAPNHHFPKSNTGAQLNPIKPLSSKFDLEDADIHEMKHPEEIKKMKAIQSKSSSSSQRTLKAHLEPIYLTDWERKPLPVRNVTEKQLTTIDYPRVNSCRKLPELWPVDDFPDADPFLPWIHDVFPTDDGKFIQFVAQNKRRCQSGTTPDQLEILEKMQPQVSLFQHVPVKRVNIKNSKGAEEIRYKLTSHEEADSDGVETRFICRFSNGQETLSQFNFNFDYVGARKHSKKLHSKEGHKDHKTLHTSQLIFMCPVPEKLVETVREGTSVIDDWATLFVTLVPIRTPPRYGAPNRFLPPKYQFGEPYDFSAATEWGDSHVLPRVEDSGRWENIPICLPTYKAYPSVTSPPEAAPTEEAAGVSLFHSTINTKKHRVVACAWASLSYATRGDRFKIDDGARRADEWIRFHLLTGIDHIFIYDNSREGAGLKDVADQFPGRVTRVPWPATVCNNNRNFHDSPGERSSQYAAESSCRLRFGPHTDWMAAMDIDEYITPVGNYTSIKDFLTTLDDNGTKIINFGSWRAWPRKDFIAPPVPIVDRAVCDEPFPCFHLKIRNDTSVLQTYNCDRQQVKTEKMPAEKQIYRTDYVLQHFVHFSTVTKFTMMGRQETVAAGMNFYRVAPDPLSRFSDEQTEVTMLHSKAIATQDTAGWQKRCTGEMKRGTCRIGVPYPTLDTSSNVTKDSEGWLYNCYVNPIIENHWVPLLNKELKKSKIIDFQAPDKLQ